MREFKTNKRRSVTKSSGFSVQGDYTGGEACIVNSERILINSNSSLIFEKKNIKLYELFQGNLGILAFGTYIKVNCPIKIHIELKGKLSNGLSFSTKKLYNSIPKNTWKGIGLHTEISYNTYNFDLDNFDSKDEFLNTISISQCIIKFIPIHNIHKNKQLIIDFIATDFDSINFQYFKNKDALKYFNQRTNMYVPDIYYLKTNLKLRTLLKSDIEIKKGAEITLKGCNRCSRLLPIDVLNPENIISFSKHCVKRAPCEHNSFNNYSILNLSSLSSNYISTSKFIKSNKIFTPYGHQLECRSCKKFFVNAPLNPQRTPQQHKEDSLRRRSFEVLINNLFDKNIIHFEHNSPKGFNYYIWEKFNKKCFKCGKKIRLEEMHLDHTMPLAYLYRLDETATCLCAEHNLAKSDKFPVDFYTKNELEKLIKITGLKRSVAYSRSINKKVVSKLETNIVWFFDIFLMNSSYYKIRDGKLTSKLIYSNLNKVMTASGYEDNYLINLYLKKTNKYPKSLYYSQ